MKCELGLMELFTTVRAFMGTMMILRLWKH